MDAAEEHVGVGPGFDDVEVAGHGVALGVGPAFLEAELGGLVGTGAFDVEAGVHDGLFRVGAAAQQQGCLQEG